MNPQQKSENEYVVQSSDLLESEGSDGMAPSDIETTSLESSSELPDTLDPTSTSPPVDAESKIHVVEAPDSSGVLYGMGLVGIILIFLVGAIAAFQFGLFSSLTQPNTYTEALQKVREMKSYQNNLVFRISNGSQIITTNGIFDVDLENDATRMFFEMKILGVVFNGDMRIFGNTIFSRFTQTGAPNESPFASPGTWIQFTPEDIPPEYEQFADTKDFADVLEVLRFDEEMITKVAEEEVFASDGRSQMHYTLELSKELVALIANDSDDNFADALSNSGVIDIWVNMTTHDIEKMLVKSDKIEIESSFSNINEPVEVIWPTEAFTYAEWKKKILRQALPPEPVQIVGIAAYGDISEEDLNIIQSVIKHEIGVDTTIIADNDAKLPKVSGLYNEDRGQFNGDVLWQFFYDQLKNDGDNVRYLIVLDDDLYSVLTSKRPFVMTRSSSINTALISTSRLRDKYDERVEETPQEEVSDEQYKKRLEKLVLRTLGVTVGLRVSPAADREECVMFPAFTLAKLDQKGSTFCEETREVLGEAFAVRTN